MSSIPYRPEIDGLRAIAVLAVLIYHAGFGFLPGGFMGVDIFFVISGFLITSFIVQDIRAGTFSMVGFWERRARRILPPLFLVVGATLCAGLLLFLPFDLVQLGKEISVQSVFGSNILFMMQGGYFDDGDQFKALLHTWSLAVEEQFYLFYPIGMALFARFLGPKFFYLVLPAAFISFVLCIYMSGISQRMAFYALPFRGWELLGGAIIALLPSLSLPRLFREMLSLCGLFMLAACLFLYNPAYAFPGWITLLPVLGAMLLIFATSGGASFTGKVLAFKPMVAIGLISYSLYLWHWPVFIFARYIPAYELTHAVAASCLALSFFLAFFSWRYVERPIRKKQVLASRKSIFIASIAGLAVLAIVGTSLIKMNGIPGRFSKDVQVLAAARHDENQHRALCDQPSLQMVQESKICQTNSTAGKPEFLLWGDSYADAIAPAFYKLSAEHGRNGFVVTGHGCPPVLDAHVAMPFRAFDCYETNKAVADLVRREKIETVYLAGNWDSYLLPGALNFSGAVWISESHYASFDRAEFKALQNTIDTLHRSGVKHVRIIVNPPYTLFDPPRDLALAKQFGQELPTVPLKDYKASIDAGIGAFRAQSEKDIGLECIELMPLLCDSDVCYAEKDGKSLYFNPGHLSHYGAEYLSPLLNPYFLK